MSEWIKCSEKMPEKYKQVLFFDGYYILIGSLFTDPETPCFLFEGGTSDSVTHWMPLPNTPEQKKE